MASEKRDIWLDAIGRVDAEIKSLEGRRKRLDLLIEQKRRHRASLEARQKLSADKRRTPPLVPPGTKITAKNEARIWAWGAILREFKERGMPLELPRHVLKKAVSRAIPSAPDSTIRSYFNRLIADGMLERRPSGMSLTENARRSVNSVE
jgi:hypothetical protein